MMKHAKSSSFFPDLLEFHVLFWAYFSTIKGEKNRERVFKERVLFLALVYLTICGVGTKNNELAYSLVRLVASCGGQAGKPGPTALSPCVLVV